MKYSSHLLTLAIVALFASPTRAQTATGTLQNIVVEKSLATVLGPVLAQANSRTVRILMGGTSIASFGYSNNRVFTSHLKALYGDALADVQGMGSVNGSWELPTAGWYKQRYSGPTFVRLRGDPNSSPLVLTGYGSQVVVEYSKESDGGVAEIEVENFANPAGTPPQKFSFDSAGPQKLSQQAIYRSPVGLLRVTIYPPKSGFAYLERVTFGQQRPGIEVIDGTLGGSNLGDIYAPSPRSALGVDSIPTQPGAGIAAFFERRDIDLVIYSGPVNDAPGYFPIWAARMDEVVEATRPKTANIASNTAGNPSILTTTAPHGLKTGDVVKIAGVVGSRPSINGSRTVTVLSPTSFSVPIAVTAPGTRGMVSKPGRPLLLVAEMGGHFSMPTDPNHTAFLEKYEYLKKLGRDHDHVLTLDWHGATADDDIVRYAANYYTTGAPVVINPATGTYTGDFIHPNTKANQVAVRMLCKSMGVPIPPETSSADLENRIRKTSPVPAGTPISFFDGAAARTGKASEFAASVFSGRKCLGILPLVFSRETANLTTLNQQIASSPASDRFGKYIEFPRDYGIAIFGQVPIGERVTLTALMKPMAPGQALQLIPPSNSPGVMYYKESIVGWCNTILYDAGEAPTWVTFDYVRGAHTALLLTGRLYSISVTRTNGQPVSTEERVYAPGAELSTLPATGLTPSSALLNASVRSSGPGNMSIAFDLGTDQSALKPAGSQNAIVAGDGQLKQIELPVSGLIANTVYYYRVRAMSAGDPTAQLGEILSFQTPAGGGQ